MVAFAFVLGGAGFLGAARLWWRHVPAFNRRLTGPPRGPFQRGAEQVNRWWGAGFLVVAGAVMVVRGLTLIGG